VIYRDFVKQFIPPILITSLRGLPIFPKPRFVWEGIYAHRRDVPTQNNSYDDAVEVRKQYDWTRAGLDLVNAGKLADLRHELLAVVAAIATARAGAVSILDFGGAVGSGYVQLMATLPMNAAIQYCVVDLPNMCAAGRGLFAGDPRITFQTRLPTLDDRLDEDRLDIVYASSVLQYIDDYCELLQQLASARAAFILLGQLAAGDIPTFATKQMNLGKKIMAYWFLNRDEVVGAFAAAGYKLVYEGLSDLEYDQSNFPETHRIGRMRNLLFRRSQSPGNPPMRS
jgi:putative methyltransferase (TIGR04325 family)